MEVQERHVHHGNKNTTSYSVQKIQVAPNEKEMAAEHSGHGHASVWYVFGFIEIVVGLRFLLQLFNAQDTGFASFIYDASNPLVSLFRGVFGAPDLIGVSSFDSAAFLALLMYPLIAWAINGLIDLVMRPVHTPSLR